MSLSAGELATPAFEARFLKTVNMKRGKKSLFCLNIDLKSINSSRDFGASTRTFDTSFFPFN